MRWSIKIQDQYAMCIIYTHQMLILAFVPGEWAYNMFGSKRATTPSRKEPTLTSNRGKIRIYYQALKVPLKVNAVRTKYFLQSPRMYFNKQTSDYFGLIGELINTFKRFNIMQTILIIAQVRKFTHKFAFTPT